ncbi:MAG: protein phosphatase 2C domain-containing protein [Rubripirellula sp.]|nr:protein phosphatase 2C domain-containing protein [Rubripirellula sp.]
MIENRLGTLSSVSNDAWQQSEYLTDGEMGNSKHAPSLTFGLSDCGRVRKVNQDQFLIAELIKSMLVSATTLDLGERVFGRVQGEILLVADGMGGHAAGEKASQLAITHLVHRLLNSVHWFFHGDDWNEDDFVENLQLLMQDANAKILRESAKNSNVRGMGTTLTMAHRIGRRMFVVHAGDSRCYLYRNGGVEQLTTDHTLARQMVEQGGMRPEDESTSRWGNVLWNVLGGNSNDEVVAEARRVDLEEGDLIVLCSDGLHRYVGPDMLAEVLAVTEHPEAACRTLVDFANSSGGQDNVTVVVAKPDLSVTTEPVFMPDPGPEMASSI